MKITSIVPQKITFDTGAEICVSPACMEMDIDDPDLTNALNSDFKFLAFTEVPGGFAFGDILGTMVKVSVRTTGSEHICIVTSNGETKLDLAVM